MSYKAIFVLCAASDLDIDHINVETAVVYGLVEGIIYVAQTTGYSDRSARVSKFQNILYCPKHSPQIWYKNLSQFFH